VGKREDNLQEKRIKGPFYDVKIVEVTFGKVSFKRSSSQKKRLLLLAKISVSCWSY